MGTANGARLLTAFSRWRRDDLCDNEKVVRVAEITGGRRDNRLWAEEDFSVVLERRASVIFAHEFGHFDFWWGWGDATRSWDWRPRLLSFCGRRNGRWSWGRCDRRCSFERRGRRCRIVGLRRAAPVRHPGRSRLARLHRL